VSPLSVHIMQGSNIPSFKSFCEYLVSLESLYYRKCNLMFCSIICFQVVYGGRVTDDFDRRIVRTYMDEYIGEFLFDTFQPYHFYRDNFVNYEIPKEGDKNDYISKCVTRNTLWIKL
jgi:hypothetical protein